MAKCSPCQIFQIEISAVDSAADFAADSFADCNSNINAV